MGRHPRDAPGAVAGACPSCNHAGVRSCDSAATGGEKSLPTQGDAQPPCRGRDAGSAGRCRRRRIFGPRPLGNGNPAAPLVHGVSVPVICRCRPSCAGSHRARMRISGSGAVEEASFRQPPVAGHLPARRDRAHRPFAAMRHGLARRAGWSGRGRPRALPRQDQAQSQGTVKPPNIWRKAASSVCGPRRMRATRPRFASGTTSTTEAPRSASAAS